MTRFSATSIRSATRAIGAQARRDLDDLIRIPSVSAAGFDPDEVRKSAESTAVMLERSGFDEVRLLEVHNAHPAIFGRRSGPIGAPTVLLYAHHDVQPTGSLESWTSPPFEPTERNRRLYGRGSADDKAGVITHATALRAWEGNPPVGISVLVEGEEEIGSPHLPEFLSRYGELFRADTILVADCANWRIGTPALTTSLRGLIDCVVEVRVLDHAVHSGAYGGPVPDAITVLARVLATLHDATGSVAVEGLRSTSSAALDLTEEELRLDSGMRPGVSLIGQGSLTERLWSGPAISVLGIDAPSIRNAANQLVASASAKISVRLAPSDDPALAAEALLAHLQANLCWGAEMNVIFGQPTPPHLVVSRGKAFDAYRRAASDAWGCQLVETGSGGSLPFLPALAAALPGAALLLTGMQDPQSNAHAENESLHLDDFARGCFCEALFLGYLAE